MARIDDNVHIINKKSIESGPKNIYIQENSFNELYIYKTQIVARVRRL